MRPGRRFWRRAVLWAVIALAVYFGTVEVQTWLGRRALEDTGLEVHTLEEGLAQARREDKLVLATVAAIWCPSCRKLDRDVLADEDVRSVVEDDYVFVRLEYESDEGKAFRERYDVSGFPRVVVLDADGSLLRRLPTTYDPEEFLNALGPRGAGG